jgi:hypothetical protein
VVRRNSLNFAPPKKEKIFQCGKTHEPVEAQVKLFSSPQRVAVAT